MKTLKIPEMHDVDVAFSNVNHLPKIKDIPEEFHKDSNKYAEFISDWFYNGAKSDKLIAKEGVDRNKALRAIKACLGSWEPKHEHKIAGCAYMLSQWFNIKD